MNKCIFIGRITKDIEVKTTQSQKEVCSFTIAVDRKFKSANGERQADFINCTAWEQRAHLLGEYFHKGSKIGIVGSLQTRKYEDKDGNKRDAVEILVDEIEFIDSKKDDRAEAPKAPPIPEPAFNPAMDDSSTALPFDL